MLLLIDEILALILIIFVAIGFVEFIIYVIKILRDKDEKWD